ncbi:MAG: short-chain dehydrogenase, partial [Devosia sp.]|nr:short-chain dehydrogenase [Devosia sp.]
MSVAVITGAGGDIGRAIAAGLVGDEYAVLLGDLDLAGPMADAAPVDTAEIATALTEQTAALRGLAQAALRDVRAMLNGAEGELETS